MPTEAAIARMTAKAKRNGLAEASIAAHNIYAAAANRPLCIVPRMDSARARVYVSLSDLFLTSTNRHLPMTTHQRDFSALVDPVKLDRLAEIAIKVGLQLQPGQDLVLSSSIAALPLTRKIVEHAYRAGAG